jgi:hypothetical protein
MISVADPNFLPTGPSPRLASNATSLSLLDLEIGVLDDERLAHLGGKLLRHRTRDDIAKATGTEADEDLHRP